MQIDIQKLKAKKSIKELLEFGIINFDKVPDCTSFDISDYVRRKLKIRKTSHFGTLDPMVTGVLPVALNRACKLTGFFLGEDKEYIGTMRIHEDVSIEKLEEAIKKGFIGKIMQLPPVKSRVKRQEREREIKNFKILKKDGKDVSFLVECQGGTYVRKLVHDLGEEMGIGAHMTGLRRIRAGIFMEKEITTKEEFEKAVEEFEKGKEEKLRKIIIPAEIIQEVYPVVQIKEDDLKHIMTGKPIHKEDLIKKEKFEKDKIICAFIKTRFIGMYKVSNSGDIFAMPEFVLQSLNK
jgi:H/ACA ribonucleoprotein complex subunit 4